MNDHGSPTLPPKARTGVPGLDDILAGGFAHGPRLPARRQPRHGQDHDRAALPAGRRGGRRAGPLHHPVRDRERAARRRGVARLDARRRDRDLRAGAAREPARCRPAAEPALFLRPRARRDDQADLRGGRARSSPSASCSISLSEIRLLGAELAALSPADPGAEALFRPPRRDRAAARRPHGRHARQDGAQHRPRRHAARGAGARLWRRAAPAAGRSSIAARRSAAAITTSSSRPAACRSFRAWWRPSIAGSFDRATASERHRGARHAAGRRHRAGLEHAAPRAGRRGQDHCSPCTSSAAAIRTRRARPRCSCSTRSSACCSIAPSRWASTSQALRDAGHAASSSRSMPPSCRPASSPTACAPASQDPTVKTVVIDSLNGYQAAMPEENSLILHMHELLQFLNRQGASTFLTVAQHGLIGRHEGAGRRHLSRRLR